jgi:hypothetical protein
MACRNWCRRGPGTEVASRIAACRGCGTWRILRTRPQTKSDSAEVERTRDLVLRERAKTGVNAAHSWGDEHDRA